MSSNNKQFKKIITYLVWTCIALFIGIVYMFIILGPKTESTGIMHIFDIIYDLALIHIGFIIGGIIAFIFILMDIFYLKAKSILLKVITLFIITFIVALIHYVLEKVIDII